MKKLIVLFFAILSIASCKKEEETTPAATNSQYVKFKSDGVQWTNSAINTSENSGVVGIQGTASDQSYIGFAVSKFSGQYYAYVGSITYFDKNFKSYNFMGGKDSITLVISQHDTINKFIKGKFSFNLRLSSDTSKKVRITDGEFAVSYKK